MNCPICSQKLPEDAIFCHKCSNQVKCKNCSKPIQSGGVICNYCGVSLITASSQAYPNRIEFKEDKNSRSLTAEFSDDTAENVVGAVSQLLSISKYSNAIPASRQIADMSMPAEGEAVVVNQPKDEGEKQETSEELNQLKDIFQPRGDELVLHETELKASSKTNYLERLALLFLYYKHLEGNATIIRKELNGFLEKYNLYDGLRKWLSSNKKLINAHNNQLSLSRGGTDKAKEYLADVFDDSKTGKWCTGSSSKKNGSKTKATTTIKSGKRGGKTYTNLGNLNLQPKGKQSLADFISGFSSMSGLKYNAVFVYYLEKILEEKNITANHIYTCYKNIKVSPPTNVYQSIIDTGARYAWVETANANDLKITISGENAVENKFQTAKK